MAPGSSSRRLSLATGLLVGSFASLLYGFKLWVIAACGNATPFWDQWDAEATYLFLPLRQGTLGWLPFVVPHAEHRIVTTRLLNTGLFVVNGLWNPLLEMIVNAGLHVLALALTAIWLSRVVGRQHLPALLLWTLLLFALPFGWENTLAGFQAQFYFLLLFSIPALWWLVTSSPLARGWWLGLVFAVMAYLSLASGVVAVAAAAATTVVCAVVQGGRDRRLVAGGAGLLVLAIAGYVWTPVWPGHAPLRASSLGQLAHGLVLVLSWPIPGSLPAALGRNLPVIVFLWRFVRRQPAASDRGWFLFSLIVWLAGQAVVLAYGRATGVLESRYLDVIAMGLVINFACVLWLHVESGFSRTRHGPPEGGHHVWLSRTVAVAAAVWIVGVAVAVGGAASVKLDRELAGKKATGTAQELNTRNFLQTGDMSHLKDKPFLTIPFPDAERLAGLLRNPTVRAFLPSNLQLPLTPLALDAQPPYVVPDGFYPTTPKRRAATLGTYGERGDAATGRGVMRFGALGFSGSVEIPVAGYPLREGIEVAVEQQGRRHRLTLLGNPGESWQMASVHLDNAPFAIEVTDFSRTTWVAVGAPAVAGRFDWVVDGLLQGWYAVLMFGGALGVLAALALTGTADRSEEQT